jgi:hypothetical protein
MDNNEEQPTEIDHGAWIPFLIRKKRFAECMILAWQEVEDKVDQMTVQEFKLSYLPDKKDARVDLLRDNIGFQNKLKFLKLMDRLSDNDISIIQKFVEERNKLFHGYVFGDRSLLVIPEEEKNHLMGLASKASQIVTNRAFGVWVDEGTGDMGNANVSRI